MGRQRLARWNEAEFGESGVWDQRWGLGQRRWDWTADWRARAGPAGFEGRDELGPQASGKLNPSVQCAACHVSDAL